MFNNRSDQTPVWQKLGLLFIMYLMQNISLGFTWVLLPLLLREQGLSLSKIGFSALVFSPWALKFLWASRIDSHYHSYWGRRKSWIAPLSGLTVFLIPLLGLMDTQTQLPMILAVIFILNLLIATTDIAVDGYATDILYPKEMSMGNTAQSVGYITGHMLGAGVFLILYQAYGWTLTLFLLTGLYLILFFPILIHKEMPIVNKTESNKKTLNFAPSAKAFLRLPRIRWFLFFLILLGISKNGGNQLRYTMLTDQGINTGNLGELLLWAGFPVSVLGSLVWGWILSKKGNRYGFILSCILIAGLHYVSSVIPKELFDINWGAGIILAGAKFLEGAMMVLIYNMMMNLSVGRQSATNYAVLCSMNHVILLGVLPLAGFVCDSTGYPVFFIGLSFFSFLTLFAGSKIMDRYLRFN